MPIAEYVKLTRTPYITPVDTGPHAPFPGGNITQTLRFQIMEPHNENQHVFWNHNNVEIVLVSQIVQAVDDEIYIVEKKTDYMAYSGVTPKELIQHLVTRYGKITEAETVENTSCLHTHIDPDQPINAYYKCIDDAIKYAKVSQCIFSK